jgi:hypothetical protein
MTHCFHQMPESVSLYSVTYFLITRIFVLCVAFRMTQAIFQQRPPLQPMRNPAEPDQIPKPTRLPTALHLGNSPAKAPRNPLRKYDRGGRLREVSSRPAPDIQNGFTDQGPVWDTARGCSADIDNNKPSIRGNVEEQMRSPDTPRLFPLPSALRPTTPDVSEPVGMPKSPKPSQHLKSASLTKH